MRNLLLALVLALLLRFAFEIAVSLCLVALLFIVFRPRSRDHSFKTRAHEALPCECPLNEDSHLDIANYRATDDVHEPSTIRPAPAESPGCLGCVIECPACPTPSPNTNVQLPDFVDPFRVDYQKILS